MKLTLKEIQKDENKHFMWCQGFQHGNIGIKKQIPSYEKESYLLGYEMGKEGRINDYLNMIKSNDKKIKIKKAYTRTK